MQITDVPDPKIEQPTDAIIKVTSTGLCGSDLHLYSVLGAFIDPGDVLGHEPMGIVEEVGSEVENIQAGDRVVIPFNISCGHCWMCERQYFAQCETTQNRDQEKGASLFGYTKMYGQVPGGQAEYLRVPQAQFGPIRVPTGRRTSASSTCRTSSLPRGRASSSRRCPTAARWPSSASARSARWRAASRATRATESSASTWSPERLEMARRYEAETIDTSDVDDVSEVIRGMTEGRGADSVLEAVGMEAHGAPVRKARPGGLGLPPRRDREAADRKCRNRPDVGPLRLLRLGSPSRHGFDLRRLRRPAGPDSDDADLRQGRQPQHGSGSRQALDRRHPAAGDDDDDPLGTEDFATHKLPLTEAPGGLRDLPEEGG